jgi:hypothetical protein
MGIDLADGASDALQGEVVMDADELQPEIEYFRDKYGIFEYQLWRLNGFLREANIRGLTVLEVGGSNLPRELVIGRLSAESSAAPPAMCSRLCVLPVSAK